MTGAIEIISKSEFARRCGVTRQAVDKALEKATRHGLVETSIDGIDPNEPWARDYFVACMEKRKKADAIQRGEIKPPNVGGLERPDLELRKLAGEVRKLELDNGKKERSLVARVLVERFIGAVDRALNMVIMDGRATLIPQLYQKIRGKCKCGEGCTVEEAQLFYHEKAGKYIAPVKPELVRALKKYDRDN